MSFYSLLDEAKKQAMVEHLTALQKLFHDAEAPSFFSDNLIALNRNLTFLYDEKFMNAFSAAAEPDTAEDQAKIWRLHTLAWCGRTALNVAGDFVECGVYKGLYSAMLTEYLDWDEIDRQFYLYDTFAGLPDAWSSEQEREGVNSNYEWDGIHDAVCPDGAVVLMDDFGRNENLELAEALMGWWVARDHCILELPTGQGMVTVNASKL